MRDDAPAPRKTAKPVAARGGQKSDPRPEKIAAFRVGISAESRAAAWLIAHGFRILARRWKSPLGEIDIVAARRHLLIFVEVKARATLDDAAEAVTPRQKRAYRRGRRVVARASSAAHDPRYALGAPFWWRRANCRGTSRRRSRARNLGKHVPDLIGDGNRFSDKITRK